MFNKIELWYSDNDYKGVRNIIVENKCENHEIFSFENTVYSNYVVKRHQTLHLGNEYTKRKKNHSCLLGTFNMYEEVKIKKEWVKDVSYFASQKDNNTTIDIYLKLKIPDQRKYGSTSIVYWRVLQCINIEEGELRDLLKWFLWINRIEKTEIYNLNTAMDSDNCFSVSGKESDDYGCIKDGRIYMCPVVKEVDDTRAGLVIYWEFLTDAQRKQAIEDGRIKELTLEEKLKKN